MKYSSANFADRSINDVAAAIRTGLESHYESVDVAVVASPDLTEFGVTTA